MGSPRLPRLRRPSAGTAFCLALIAVGIPTAGLVRVGPDGLRGGDTANYAVSPVSMAGWKEVPHGPQTLFLYRDPKTGLLLRGAVNQIIADVNPTPELHTDGIAQHFIDRTKENMPDWNVAKAYGDVAGADGMRFRLIRRERPGKCVITAFAVKGNTTLIVSLSANGEEIAEIDSVFPQFQQVLAGMTLTKTLLE